MRDIQETMMYNEKWAFYAVIIYYNRENGAKIILKDIKRTEFVLEN